MKAPAKLLLERSADRPDGYIEEILANGHIDGDQIEIDDDVLEALRAKYSADAPPPLDLLQNLAAAANRWRKAGCPVVDEKTLDLRKSTCAACRYWNPKKWFGLGQCTHPGCGCTRMKLLWATERCPKKPPAWEANLDSLPPN